jgi:hypothetical protein
VASEGDGVKVELLAAELEGTRHYFEEVADGLGTDLAAVATDVEALNERVDNNSDVTDLETTVDDLIERLDDELEAVQDRLSALEPAKPVSDDGMEPWTVTATDQEWAALAAWVDWLNTDYELGGDNRVAPCWPAHMGASEQLASLWHAWHAARAAQIANTGEQMMSWHERWLWAALPHITASLKLCAQGHAARSVAPLTDLSILNLDPQNPGKKNG